MSKSSKRMKPDSVWPTKPLGKRNHRRIATNAAMTSMGFVLVLSLAGLSNVVREFWHRLVGRVAGLASSLLFLGYLVAFLLVLPAAFLSQEQGVMFSHFFGLGLGAIAGIALVLFYRPAGGPKSQSHKSCPN